MLKKCSLILRRRRKERSFSFQFPVASLNSSFFLVSILLLNKFQIFHSIVSPNNDNKSIVMFSDNSIQIDYADLTPKNAYYIELLKNDSLIHRVELAKSCSLSSIVSSDALDSTPSFTPSYLSSIIINTNFTSISFELSKNDFSCEQILDLFCNSFQLKDRFLLTHNIIDCDDSIPATTQQNNKEDNLNIVTMTPTFNQWSTVLLTISKTFKLGKYGMIYGNTDSNNVNTTTTDSIYFEKFIEIIVYKLSSRSQMILEFAAPINSQNLAQIIKSRVINSNFRRF
jgi:hypothetical protein